MRKLRVLLLFIIIGGNPVLVAAQAQCYEINNLEIQGGRHLSLWRFKKLKKKYEAKCLTVGDIREITRIITNIYIEDGFVTSRVYIPEQNLNGKLLIIAIQEGLIEDVEYATGYGMQANSLPVTKNQILNLRDIEQGVDNFNRLKSNSVNVYLKPGEKPGASVIVVDNKPSKKWHISTGVDNSGSKNRGRNQSFTNFSFENLFGLNEYYGLGYRIALGNHSRNFMHSYSANILLPFGYNNFTFQYNQAFYRNFIQTPRNYYSNKGGSKIAKVNFDRVIHRDGSSKTVFAVGGGIDNYSNYIAENKIEMSTYRLHKFDLGLRHQRRLASSSVGLGLTFTGGENQNYLTDFAKIALPSRKFYKITGNFSWRKPLMKIRDGKTISYNFQLNSQYSPDMLVATEKENIGGLSSVRGFTDYSENADNTVVVRNEMEIDLPSFNLEMSRKIFGELIVFCAFDLGKFSNYEEQGTRSGIMSGVAAGIRNRSGYLNFSATVAKPLEAPVAIRHKPVFYFSVAVDV